MIDPSAETLVSFSEAPNHIPGRPHISTIHRWRLRGVRGKRLETLLRGGRRYTSLEAIQRFLRLDDFDEVADPNQSRPSVPDDAVARELDRIGI
jgi:hypothetical protein